MKHLLIAMILFGTGALYAIAGIYQAENGDLYKAVLETKNSGYEGAGYVNFDNESGSYLELRVGMRNQGEQDVTIRFANGTAGFRPMQVDLNGEALISSIEFGPTGGWTEWDELTIQVPFDVGVNTLRFTSTGAEGGPNIDKLDITGEQLPTYNVNFTVSGEGTVKVLPADGLLFEGMEIRLVAQSGLGYTFREWLGDYPGSQDTLEILLYADVQVTAVFDVLDIEIPVPDFSMSGYAAMPGDGLETTAGGLGGDTIVIETLQDLIAWGKEREDNSTPEIVLIRGLIEADPTQVITVKRGGNISILGDTTDGAKYAELKNVSLNIRDYSNVIIRNLKMHEVFYPDDDLTIDHCHHVWIDHCELFSKIGSGIGVDTYDGLLDIKNGSHNVTVSWCYFHDHMKTLLMGHSDNNGDLDFDLQATFHHNWFSNTDGRNPSLRFGQIHFYNNYLENISDYGLAIRNGAHAKIENCHFESVTQPVTTDKFEGHGYACITGCVYTGSCTEQDNQVTEPTGCDFWETRIPYTYDLEDVQTVALSVAAYAGVGKLQLPDTLEQEQDTTDVTGGRLEEVLEVKAFYSRLDESILVDFSSAASAEITVTLHNANGALFHSKKIHPGGGQQRTALQVSGYAPGLYILNLYNDRTRVSKKIVLY